jgi:hypothetical protein
MMEEKEQLEAIRLEYDRAIKAQTDRDHMWGVLTLVIHGKECPEELADDAMLNYWSFDKFKEEIGY